MGPRPLWELRETPAWVQCQNWGIDDPLPNVCRSWQSTATGKAAGPTAEGRRVTPAEIIARLFNGKGVTPERVQKAQRLARQSNVSWERLIQTMDADQRQQLTEAGHAS